MILPYFRGPVISLNLCMPYKFINIYCTTIQSILSSLTKNVKSIIISWYDAFVSKNLAIT